jgi:hypothetical protein
VHFADRFVLVCFCNSYDDSTITFIATKTDDLSCTEVIGALSLDDDPELVRIESALDEALAGTEEWTGALDLATKSMKGGWCVPVPTVDC